MKINSVEEMMEAIKAVNEYAESLDLVFMVQHSGLEECRGMRKKRLKSKQRRRQMTNLERLRTMTADEIIHTEGCALDIRCDACHEMNGRSDYCPGDCRGMLKKWLESEAKEQPNDKDK